VIRNIIFDWSGTLVDDLPAVWRASNHVFSQAGVEELSLDRFRAEFQLPFEGFYRRYTPDVPMDRLEEWFHSRFREVQESVVPLPHAREFLDLCRRHDIRTFLLSAVHPDHYAVQAASTGFGGFIDHPYVGVWDKRDRIRGIVAEHGLDPAHTLFIGDMQHDIDTAKHGGLHSVAVLTGYNGLEQLRASQPDLIVEHLGELRRIFERDAFHLPHQRPANQSPRSEPMPISTVGAAIFNDAGEVLMIRTQKWSSLWGIPGGKIHWGEASEDALRREVLEETALSVTDVEFILVQDCIHSTEFYRDAHFLLLNYTCRALGEQPVTLNEEAQEFRWVSLDDAFALPLNTPTRVLLDALVARRAALA
jgi:phosphoglycolate phosphatase-like HAD superfamily hydrolase/ADP-ribose pyrophosphatase YjhB (NUDIX family)